MADAQPAPYTAYKVRQELKPKSLNDLSDKMIDQHWKLYEGYVTNVNLLNKLIWDVLEAGAEINNAKNAEQLRRLGFEYNGMVLHEYYFSALRAGSTSIPTSKLAVKIAQDFGSIERWKTQFAGVGKMRGIGWAITCFDPLANKLGNYWVTDHENGNIAGFVPIIVMDVWEHAYVLDYGATAAPGTGRGAYIEAYFRNLSWDVLEERFQKAIEQKPTR